MHKSCLIYASAENEEQKEAISVGENFVIIYNLLTLVSPLMLSKVKNGRHILNDCTLMS